MKKSPYKYLHHGPYSMCGFMSESFQSVSTYIDTGTQAQVAPAKIACQQFLSIWIGRFHKKRNVWLKVEISKGVVNLLVKYSAACCENLWGYLSDFRFREILSEMSIRWASPPLSLSLPLRWRACHEYWNHLPISPEWSPHHLPLQKLEISYILALKK